MVLEFPLVDLLYDLFEVDKGNESSLQQRMIEYYTFNGIEPQVQIRDGNVRVSLDVSLIAVTEKDYRKAISLCERGKFEEASKELRHLLGINPTNSEYHRLLGQVESELGKPDAAIDALVDALRWNPKNKHALVMMGNVWAKQKDEPKTALKYYESALAVDPKDFIAANNIAVQYMQAGDFETAESWFNKALSIQPDYPNTHHGLALLSLRQEDPESTFYSATEAIKLNPRQDELFRQSLKLATDTARILSNTRLGADTVAAVAHELEIRAGKPVRILEDGSIPTAAKLELAENYGQPHHMVRYNSKYPCFEHLQLHELYHLRYVLEAREANVNQLYIVRSGNKEAFIRTQEKHLKKLHREGFSENSIANYITGIFEGLNRQIFNAPVDLFIEFDIYNEHPEMRPYQFISLKALIDEAIQANVDKRIVELSATDVVSKSKTYNLTLAMLYRELFGVDRVNEFRPTPHEKRLAEKFYEEFVEYRSDREPGEEYEVVNHWAKDLQLDNLFSLVSEVEYRGAHGSPISGVDVGLAEQIEQIESDPLDQRTRDPVRQSEMETFLKSQADIGVNMAVVMFMVDALQYMRPLPKQKVKDIALEIAMLGTQGIAPQKKGYKLHHVPAKSFSGYHLLAYYYVSWKLAIPEMLQQLQLPYDSEYEMAVKLASQ